MAGTHVERLALEDRPGSVSAALDRSAEEILDVDALLGSR